MKNFLTPSAMRAIGLLLFAGYWTASSVDAQPPLPPPPAPGVEALPSVVETVPIVDPSIIQDDIPPTRLGVSHQIFGNGFDEPFTDLRLFAPTGDDERVLFFDGRLLFANDLGISRIGYNFGAGARAYNENTNTVWGINLFGDRRQTSLQQYHQVGFGWELLSDRWEMRNNFYLPVGTKRVVTASSPIFDPAGEIFFHDNSIASRTARSLQTFEQVLRGFDLEFGGRLNRRDQAAGNWLVRGYTGFYYYQNPDLDDLPGASMRLNANYRDAVVADAQVRYDRHFGTQASIGMTVFLDGLFDRNQTFHSRTMDVRNHLARPVQRKQYITAIRDQGVVAADEFIDLTDPGTGLPITVTHVSVNAAAGGAGTFESPFLSLTDADASTNDIVYVHAGGTYDGQAFSLLAGQRLLGEGGGFVHSVETDELGTITLLSSGNGGTDKPIILNSAGTAVTLASNSEVANLQITTPMGSAIVGTSVTDALINEVMVTDPEAVAVLLDNSDVDILDSKFTTSDEEVFGIDVSGASMVDVQDSSIKTNGSQATGINIAGGSVVTLDNTSLVTFGNGIELVDMSSVSLSNGSSIMSNANGVIGDNSALILDASSITATGQGVELSGTSTLSASNGSSITTMVSNISKAIALEDFTIADISDSTISATNDIAIYLINDAMITLDSSQVSASSDTAIRIEDNAIGIAQNGTMITTNGVGSLGGNQYFGIGGVDLDSDAQFSLLSGSSIITTGENAHGIINRYDSVTFVQDSSITTSGNYSVGIFERTINLDPLVTVENSEITTMGLQAHAILLVDANSGDTPALSVTGSTLTTSGMDADGITMFVSDNFGNWDLTISDNTISSAMSDEIFLDTHTGSIVAEIFGNTLQSGSGTVVLDNSSGILLEILGPSFNSLSDFATSNGIPNGNIMESGTITYTPSP